MGVVEEGRLLTLVDKQPPFIDARAMPLPNIRKAHCTDRNLRAIRSSPLPPPLNV